MINLRIPVAVSGTRLGHDSASWRQKGEHSFSMSMWLLSYRPDILYG